MTSHLKCPMAFHPFEMMRYLFAVSGLFELACCFPIKGCLCIHAN
jgi:hypothetical protein